MSRPNVDREKFYIPTLDGWRALAILAVLVAHGSSRFVVAGSSTATAAERCGAFGVDIFFAISGLLICSRLLAEKAERGYIRIRVFYLRRAFRILPAAIGYLLCLAILDSKGLINVNATEWLSCLFFWRNYLPADFGWWWTGHFWSLAVEEHFYIIIPFALAVLGRKINLRLTLSLALLIAVWRSINFKMHLNQTLFGGAGLYSRTDLRLDGLLFGCWFALLISGEHQREKLAVLNKSWVFCILCTADLVCLIKQPPMAMFWISVLTATIVTATTLNSRAVFSRILETPALKWIGRLSYSLYLWQQLFLGPKVPAGSAAVIKDIRHMPLAVLLLVIAATTSYYFLEMPMRRIGARVNTRVLRPRQAISVDLQTTIPTVPA